MICFYCGRLAGAQVWHEIAASAPRSPLQAPPPHPLSLGLSSVLTASVASSSPVSLSPERTLDFSTSCLPRILDVECLLRLSMSQTIPLSGSSFTVPITLRTTPSVQLLTPQPGRHSLFLYLIFLLYWSRVDIQCCVSFRCTAQ